MEQHRSFLSLGGQSAPQASTGRGIQALYRCGDCQRIWLQDGPVTSLELTKAQIEKLAMAVGARDLHQLPLLTCSICQYRNGQGRVCVDEYAQGQGFGLCWEMVRPTVLHAISAVQSQTCASLAETR